MSKLRKRFTQEELLEITKQSFEANAVVTQIAGKFGIAATTLNPLAPRVPLGKQDGVLRSGNKDHDRRGARNCPPQKAVTGSRTGTGNLKKSHRHLLQERREIYQFIRNNRLEFPVEKMCKVLGVSRSGYYRCRRQQMDTERLDDHLDGLIQESIHSSKGTYGSPRIWYDLVRQGIRVSRATVTRRMQRKGLSPKAKKR